MAKNNLLTQQWYDSLSRLVTHLGDNRFHSLLVRVVKQIAPFEHAVIIAYPDGERPVHIFNDLPEKQIKPTLETYLNGAYLLDPFYGACQEHKAEGCYRLRTLAPDEFYQSEYYRSYYEETYLEDEVGILVEVSEGLRVIVSLGIRSGQVPLSNADLTSVEIVLPLLTALCRRHWKEAGLSHVPDYRQRESDIRLSETLDLAFQNFGRDYLSDRECEVVRFVLKGHSSQSIADVLHISVETVKAHRKHVHRKLNISSHAELFSLFLNAISLAAVGSIDDPLNAYYAATTV